MTQIERACLNDFLVNYQHLQLQIDNRQEYLADVDTEIDRLEKEFRRVNKELTDLKRKKEIVINKFADAFLANDVKQKRPKTP